MSKRMLKITKNGKTHLQKIESTQPLKLDIQVGEEYQLVDEFGHPINGMKIVENGQEIHLYQTGDNVPSVILENDTGFPAMIGENSVSTSRSVVATEVNSGSSLTTLAYIGGGLLAVGGIAAAVGGGSKGGKGSNADNPAPAKNTAQTEAAEAARKQAEEAEKNRLAEEAARKQAEEAEKKRLAEEVARKQAEEAEKQRLVEEADRKQAEEVEKKRLAEESARKQAEEAEKKRLAEEVARKQAEEAEKKRLSEEAARKQAEEVEKQRLAEEVARKQAEEAEKKRLAEEAARKQAEEAEKQRLEEEDNVPPTVTFNLITGDDVINAEEAKRAVEVSGTVANLKDGDSLTLKVGQVSYVAQISGNHFTANVDGKTLASHAQITAEVVRAGKSVATQAKSYEVKTTLPQPDITLNDIAGDNVINLAESRKNVTVSGTVANAKEGDEVIVMCGCPTCQGIQWIEKRTQLQAGGFSVDFAGSEMTAAGYNIVKARIATTDANGNTGSDEESKSYKVDITPPAPSLTFDTIPTINQTTGNTIRVSGGVIDLQAGESGTVKAVLNGETYTSQITNNRYNFDIPKAQFANGNKIALSLNVTDKAGNPNENTQPQEQGYTYDVDLATPTVTINTPSVVNKQTTELTLSGTISHDTDVSKRSVEVKMLPNGKTYQATIDGNNWTLTIPASEINTEQGTRNFSVTVKVADQAGNRAEAIQNSLFTVDTLAPEVQLQFNAIDTVTQEGEAKIRVSGTATGELKSSDKVVVLLGSERQEVAITSGRFEAEFDRTTFLSNAAQKITARIVTVDDAGNRTEKTAEKTYEIEQNSAELRLTLNEIANDDRLNVTEAQQPTTTISGRLLGSGNTNKAVTLTVGGESVTVNTDNAGKFRYSIQTEKLLKSGSYQVQASVEGADSVSRNYAVDEWAVNKIQITEIGDSHSISGSKGVVTITGKLDISGTLMEKWNNASMLNGLEAHLNGKTYSVGLYKNRTFRVDIPENEIRAAEGQTITFSLPKDKIKIYDATMGRTNQSNWNLIPKWAELSDQNKYRLDSNPALDGRKIATFNEPMTVVRGVVSGNAKVDDDVIVRIGEKEYTTKVDSQMQFNVLLSTRELQAATNKTITATLVGKNGTGAAASVTDSAIYATGGATGEVKISPDPIQYADDDATRGQIPYFIQALRYWSNPGYLKNFAYGQGGEISYQFLNSRDDNMSFAYNQANRELTRKYLKGLEDLINIRFVEYDVNALKEDGSPFFANMRFEMKGWPTNGLYGKAAFGGPEVWLNHNYYQYYGDNAGLDSRKGYHTSIHEVFHTMGLVHTFEGVVILSTEEDDKNISVMSYKDRHNFAFPKMGMYDLMQLHYRYGVNVKHRSGNDVYTFKAFNPYSPDGDIYVWDGAGIDTFDASDQKQGVTVDLTPGSWIYSGQKTERFVVDQVKNWQNIYEFFNDPNQWRYRFDKYNDIIETHSVTYFEGQAFIGHNTQIERLIGSDHKDTLKGNVADNDIFGGNGDDEIWGNAGNDYLDGGLGNDTMHGGTGNDTYVIESEHDRIIENLNEGIDTVHAHVSYTLAENVENLVLMGDKAIDAIGNTLANRITGNDQANTLIGGGGADIFVFNSPLNGQVDHILDFEADDKIELAREIFSAVEQDNLFAHIQYDSGSGKLSYDPDAKGKQDAIHFADLPQGLTMTQENFIIA